MYNEHFTNCFSYLYVCRWTAAAHDKFSGLKLSDGMKYFLGTLRPKSKVLNQRPISKDYAYRPRSYFNAQTKWPAWIHPAMDQGHCAASWAFSAASKCHCPFMNCQGNMPVSDCYFVLISYKISFCCHEFITCLLVSVC